MRVETLHLGHGNSLDFSPRPVASGADSGLSVILGRGRGCVLRVVDQPAGVWLPLRGRLQLRSATAEIALHPGEILISEPEARVQAIGRGNALWLAVLGGTAAWQRALGGLPTRPPSAAALLPARHAADRDVRRLAIGLARSGASGDPVVCLEALIDRVAAMQEAFAPAIARCPGRTYAQRRQVFLRLQRVRNYLTANCHLEIDNDALAKLASYSPWHFIRAFRAAYQETPHAFLVRARLDRACQLLRAGELAVAEVALASGFENRCAFSRLFRQRFGVSAGAMRRRESVGREGTEVDA